MTALTEEQRAFAERMLREHSGLVYWYAKRFGLADSDGMQVLRFALLLAVRHFDAARGPFNSLVGEYLHGAAIQERRRRLPVHVSHLAWRHRSLLKKGRDTIVSNRTRNALIRCGTFEVIDVATLDDDEEPADDAVLDVADLVDSETNYARFVDGMVHLDKHAPRKAEVVALRFAGLSQVDIGAMWNLTRQRVEQLESAAVKWLRQYLKAERT